MALTRDSESITPGFPSTIVEEVFEEGKLYTRSEISSLVGGNPQQFLPMRGGRVVCGCFRRDLNPDAPRKVLVGLGPQRERSARYAVDQGSALPIFVKEEEEADNRSWEYVGRYCATRYQTDGPELQRAAADAGREPIAGILHLVPTSTEPS